MDVKAVSKQNFSGKFIYDKSLSAHQIGVILKSADKEILKNKNYDLRFWHRADITNGIFITAENEAKNIKHTILTVESGIKKSIPKVMKLYERKTSFFYKLIASIYNFFVK